MDQGQVVEIPGFRARKTGNNRTPKPDRLLLLTSARLAGERRQYMCSRYVRLKSHVNSSRRPSAEPRAVLLCQLSSGIALGQQLVERVAAARLRLHDQTATVDNQADGSTGLQVQHFENRWGNGEHNRTTDFPQIGGVQWLPPRLYLYITCSF